MNLSPELIHALKYLGLIVGALLLTALAWKGAGPSTTAQRNATRRRHPAYRGRPGMTIPRQRNGNGSRL